MAFDDLSIKRDVGREIHFDNTVDSDATGHLHNGGGTVSAPAARAHSAFSGPLTLAMTRACRAFANYTAKWATAPAVPAIRIF